MLVALNRFNSLWVIFGGVRHCTLRHKHLLLGSLRRAGGSNEFVVSSTGCCHIPSLRSHCGAHLGNGVGIVLCLAFYSICLVNRRHGLGVVMASQCALGLLQGFAYV